MDAASLPRWRGFNLLEKFTLEREEPYRETDFEWISTWGFDFVRLPMDYRCWLEDVNERTSFDESTLEEIDRAIEYGQRYDIHVSLNFHRIPGFCINRPELEPYDLFSDEDALDVAARHWRRFAERYREIPSEAISFNLFNEPVAPSTKAYERVLDRLVGEIRDVDPDRLIIADGLGAGRDPVAYFSELEVAGGTRGYDPMPVSHYMADWVSGERWDEPTWPLESDEYGYWDRDRLREECLDPWQALEEDEVGIHVGECGVYNETPHDVGLAWLQDFLELWEEAGWGWALWNFRGDFGVLDSGRDDVEYEDWHGHDLDRELLELLREY